MTRTMLRMAIAALTTLSLALPALAQYVGPGPEPSTVKEIVDHAVDDVKVTLRGHIVRRLGGDKYLFSDGTGEIQVDIDDDKFPMGTPVSDKTTVEIYGKVDKDFMRGAEIDVKRLTIVSI